MLTPDWTDGFVGVTGGVGVGGGEGILNMMGGSGVGGGVGIQ